MQKSLIAFALAGVFPVIAAVPAHAQSNVTVYGSFDAGLRHRTNANAAGDNVLTMDSSGTYHSNRLGFKGVEDLGGGLKTHFVLETGFSTGTGKQSGDLFGRAANLGIGGGWGDVTLGRQYSINFNTIGVYDPFNYKFTGIIPVAGQGGITRYSNDIKYTGKFGPVTARIEYALGEVPGSTSNGASTGVGATWKGGAFAAGAAYMTGKRNVATSPAVSYQDKTNWTIGGTYKIGPARLAAGYADDKQEQGAGVVDSRTKNTWLGGSYALAPAATVSAAWYRTKASSASADGRRDLLIVGATYALSKRTSFYADVDSSKFSGTYTGSGKPAAAGQTRVTGISAGIDHLF